MTIAELNRKQGYLDAQRELLHNVAIPSDVVISLRDDDSLAHGFADAAYWDGYLEALYEPNQYTRINAGIAAAHWYTKVWTGICHLATGRNA
jgi:hypothetical protein